MADGAVQNLIDSIFSMHGVRLGRAQAAAMLAERDSYAHLTAEVGRSLMFDDEPGNFLHTRAGTRGWRGAAR